MNCEQARQRMTESLYGELPAQEAAGLAKHVDECAVCRKEYAELKRTRQALDAVEAPSAAVDLATLYRTASQRGQRATRRWRRVALGLAAALAASLLVAALCNLDVRFESRRIVVRWGTETMEKDAAVASQPTVPFEPLAREAKLAKAQTLEISARLEVLSELVQALAADVADRDQQRSASIAVLQRNLDDLRRHASYAWAGSQRDIEALYAAQFRATSTHPVEQGE